MESEFNEMDDKKVKKLDERKLSKEERAELIKQVVERLSSAESVKVADSNRTGAAREMGIMNSFAWRGW